MDISYKVSWVLTPAGWYPVNGMQVVDVVLDHQGGGWNQALRIEVCQGQYLYVPMEEIKCVMTTEVKDG